MTDEDPTSSPLALQLARVEKSTPPTVSDICEAAVLATVELLDDERSRPGGIWHDAVAAWNGARIRKIMRRGRASAWERAQEPDGVTVRHRSAEVRAFVPGPLDQAPAALAKLQIQSTDLDEPARLDALPRPEGEVEGSPMLWVVLTPEVTMSWGKRAAQCAHAGQLAWQQADPGLVSAWNDAGRPVRVIHATPALWEELRPLADVSIHDGGFTEIPAGTLTALALWSTVPAG
ncbi:MAG: hypothetical protein R2733_26580 [Acidimicrobiales bacterium]